MASKSEKILMSLNSKLHQLATLELYPKETNEKETTIK